jgi:hypothetical protein
VLYRTDTPPLSPGFCLGFSLETGRKRRAWNATRGDRWGKGKEE